MQTKKSVPTRKFKGARVIAYIMIAALSFGAVGCNSAKKAAAAKAAAEAKAKAEADRLKKEEEERLKKEAEARERAKREPYTKLEGYFSQIASAGSVDAANQSIQNALNMFASPETPLLIVINKSGAEKDYDKPTTVKKYLEYLKDQKKNTNTLTNLVFDANGKITEVELTKK